MYDIREFLTKDSECILNVDNYYEIERFKIKDLNTYYVFKLVFNKEISELFDISNNIILVKNNIVYNAINVCIKKDDNIYKYFIIEKKIIDNEKIKFDIYNSAFSVNALQENFIISKINNIVNIKIRCNNTEIETEFDYDKLVVERNFLNSKRIADGYFSNSIKINGIIDNYNIIFILIQYSIINWYNLIFDNNYYPLEIKRKEPQIPKSES